MIIFIRSSKNAKIFALFIAQLFLVQIFYPTVSFALTGGPASPETAGFKPAGDTELVDLFTGDFSYSIPLMDVDGYPMNLSYSANVTMDQEASWVGLGWTLTPGAIIRNVRGLPDDFKGDVVSKTFNMKDNVTTGGSLGGGAELFGIDGLSLSKSTGVKYNNYDGIGFVRSMGISVPIAGGSSGKGALTAGLGLSSSSSGGLDITPSASFSAREKNAAGKMDKIGGVGISASFNSRKGMEAMGMSISSNKESNITMASSSLSFAIPSYTPNIQMPMRSESMAFSGNVGGTAYALDGTVDVSGYRSVQRLAKKYSIMPAYGYNYLEYGQQNQLCLLDYNRENDGSFSKNTPALPTTMLTYDTYSVTGQGIGGSFRAHRGDVGYVQDHHVSTTSGSESLGAEFAGGALLHGGFDVSTTDVTTTTSCWSDYNFAKGHLTYKKKLQTNARVDPLYESFCFKFSDEMNVESDLPFFNSYGGAVPVNLQLAGEFGYSYGLAPTLENKWLAPTAIGLPSSNIRSERIPRAQHIQYLTKERAVTYGLNKNYYNGGANSIINSGSEDHHVAELTVIKNNGQKYVYGYPIYNTLKKEVTFNVSGRGYDKATGLVHYDGTDNSENNSRGRDNYFSSTVTPPYASEYLLTAVLSHDYIDVDENGPSYDDLGAYTKFIYEKTSNSYQWRMPYAQDSATYNEGLRSDKLDDKGSYLFGSKELVYIDTIKTKNYIAVFNTENRHDALGVSSEDGGRSALPATGQKMKLLRSIDLYTVNELEQSNPTPLKTVHFEYNYSLCQNNPSNDGETAGIDNDGGKLTLQKVYFTYGNSYRAMHNAYEFDYNEDDPDYNPDYNSKAYNRWGYFKPNTSAGGLHDPPSTIEFPYVNQPTTDLERAYLDTLASSWCLHGIDLPSGGKISINYESDDYAYVQDKVSAQMFNVVSIEDNASFSPSSVNKDLYDGSDSYPYLFFKLQEAIVGSAPDAKQQLFDDYLKGNIDNLYFSFLVNMKSGYTNDFYERVNGYCNVEDYGIKSSAGSNVYDYGYVKLKEVKEDNNSSSNVTPIARAAWQFGRLYAPKAVFDQPQEPGLDLESAITQLNNSRILKNIKEMMEGPNGMLRSKGYCHNVILHKSWIRLNTPKKVKVGGGNRVKSIYVSDEWDQMAPAGYSSVITGKKYEYTLHSINESETISSGVANWEPAVGGDENPHKLPIYNPNFETAPLAPDDRFYFEAPIGEMHFPNPMVGYQKVRVINFVPENEDQDDDNQIFVERHGTGMTVHEFYTAKDFPTITSRTELDPRGKTSPRTVMSFLKVSYKEAMTATQGFVVETNNMHGKPKAKWIYQEGQTSTTFNSNNLPSAIKPEPISGELYVYQTEAKNAKKLASFVSTADRGGTVSNKNTLLGVDYDFVADFREQRTDVESVGINSNLASFLIALIPGIFPVPMPSQHKEETIFRSATFSKHIHRKGILKHVVKYDLGAWVLTRNQVFDEKTGDAVITRMNDNYDQKEYNVNFPAHWAYDRMGLAADNQGAKIFDLNYNNSWFDTLKINNGLLVGSLTPGKKYLFVGDHVEITKATGAVEQAWVLGKYCGDNKDCQIFLIDENGDPIETTYVISIEVLNSGKKNHLTESVGNFLMSSNPITSVGSTSKIRFSSTGADTVFIASAQEFTEVAKTNFKRKVVIAPDTCSCNEDTTLFDDLTTFINYLSGDTNQDGYVDLLGIPGNYQNRHEIKPSGAGTGIFTADLFNEITAKHSEIGTTHPLLWSVIPPSNWQGSSAENSTVIVGHIYDVTSPQPDYPPFLFLINEWSNGASWNSLDSGSFTNMRLRPYSPCDVLWHYDLLVDATIDYIDDSGVSHNNETVTIWLNIRDFFDPIKDCTVDGQGISTVICDTIVDRGKVINPFLAGIRGNWKPAASYHLPGARAQETLAGSNNNNLNIRHDGHIQSYVTTGFEKYWEFGDSDTGLYVNPASSWYATSTVSGYDVNGLEIENRNVLDNFSTALIGYNTNVTAVSNNCTQNSIAFTGFEDYSYQSERKCLHDNLDIYEFFADDTTSLTSHTGKYSLKLEQNSGGYCLLSAGLQYTQNAIYCHDYNQTGILNEVLGPYQLKYCDDRGGFGIQSTMYSKYLVSLWVKESEYQSDNGLIDHSQLEFISSDTVSFKAIGNPIEGWQKMEAEISTASTGGTLKFWNTSQSEDLYIDDLRITPFNSSVKSYVYDPYTLRLSAELDENNYATFYEYDEQGQLVRTKKETQRGIYTINENQVNVVKN